MRFTPEDSSQPMVVEDIEPAVEENIFVINPPEVRRITDSEPIPIPEKEFNVTFSPADGTKVFLNEISFKTTASSVTVSLDNGDSVTVSVLSFLQHCIVDVKERDAGTLNINSLRVC